MYCVNCGVKLADTEKTCPLCGVVAYHPDITRSAGEPLYPNEKFPEPRVSPKGAKIIVTTLFIIPLLITLLCDFQIHDRVTWSGYVIGGLIVGYVMFVLPWWFNKPNPAIFLPCIFASIALYLLYISLYTKGYWFLSFGLPVTGGVALIVTAVVVLLRYLPKGILYILGGGGIAVGLFIPLVEYLSYITFDAIQFLGWSFYPMIVLVILGGMLIFLAICRPARESMERRFFL
ncbi:MAG: zinc ribbon domain-containing protein [Ruminococcaceae bacterium]|nr:zinc ribbon domain-containing protein [Oscillospiraceae bacterium]